MVMPEMTPASRTVVEKEPAGPVETVSPVKAATPEKRKTAAGTMKFESGAAEAAMVKAIADNTETYTAPVIETGVVKTAAMSEETIVKPVMPPAEDIIVKIVMETSVTASSSAAVPENSVVIESVVLEMMPAKNVIIEIVMETPASPA